MIEEKAFGEDVIERAVCSGYVYTVTGRKGEPDEPPFFHPFTLYRGPLKAAGPTAKVCRGNNPVRIMTYALLYGGSVTDWPGEAKEWLV